MLDRAREYFAGFDPRLLPSVLQSLEYFQCCPEVIDVLSQLEVERLESARKLSERKGAHIRARTGGVVGTPSGRVMRQVPEPQPLTVVVGFCPRCGSSVMGEPLSACERQKNKRVFYKECSSCSYYAEVFQRGNKYVEIEEG